MKRIDNRSKKKIIQEFRRYIEDYYMDFINQEVIEIYSLQKELSPEETHVLERRFL